MSTRSVPLGDVVEIIRDAIPPEAIQPGTSYVGLESITSDGEIFNVRIVGNGDLGSTKFAFTPRHVLYGKLRPYLRKIARPDFEGICSTDILPLLPGPKIDRNYLAHFLRLDSSIAFAESRSVGVNLPRISPNVLATLEVPLPPLEEQRRIAAILDKADALRQKRRLALQKLDSLTQSIFLDMFGDPMDPNAEWLVVELNDVAEFENGDRSANYPSGDDIKKNGVLFLNSKNIVADRIDLTTTMFISEEKFESLSRGKAKKGDLIITLRGTLGSCCLFDGIFDRAFINAQMMIIRTNKRVNSRFLHALLTSLTSKAEMARMSSGVAVPQLTAAQLKGFPIIVPPMTEQLRFSELVSKLQSQRMTVAKQLEQIDRSFFSLQHRVFRGEL